MLRHVVFSILCFFQCLAANGVEERPEFAKEVVRAVHRVRSGLEAPEKFLREDIALLKTQIEKLSEAGDAKWVEFAQYAYGRGLLYLDDFYEDLLFLSIGLVDPEAGPTFRERISELHFDSVVERLAFASLYEGAGDRDWGLPVQKALDSISAFETTAKATLAAEDRFREASGVATKKLKWIQSTVVMIASGFGMHAAWHLLGIDKLTPREFVGFLFSVWAANEALYWIIWERFKWIDPYKKTMADKEYRELIDTWNRLLDISPALTAQKAASAAATKPTSSAKYADAQADAALEALFESLRDDDTSNDDSIKSELFRILLTELEGGNGWRATRIFKALKERDPDSKAARMSIAVAEVFRVRGCMERKALIYEMVKATFRLSVLGLLVYGSNEALKALLPDNLQQWRTVANWILGGLGIRRIYPLIWLPHPVDALKRRATKEDRQLRAAFDDLLKSDDTGKIVERIAEYDSGVAAQQLVTFAAADALAAHPTGERTRALWNVINHELASTHPAGSRVNQLLDNTYMAQKSCAMRLLNVVRALDQQLK